MEEGNGLSDLDKKEYVLACTIHEELVLLNHYNIQLNEQVKLLTRLNYQVAELIEEKRWQRFIKYCNTPCWRYKC